MKLLAKTCNKCRQSKPLDDFHKASKTKDGFHRNCKSCVLAYQRDYYNANPECQRRSPEAQRAGKLWVNYRLRPEQFQAILEAQNYGCAICGDEGQLVVDHDHNCCPSSKGQERTCGKCIRQLLCHRCNQAIGLLREDPFIIESALAYIAKHNSTRREI